MILESILVLNRLCYLHSYPYINWPSHSTAIKTVYILNEAQRYRPIDKLP